MKLLLNLTAFFKFQGNSQYAQAMIQQHMIQFSAPLDCDLYKLWLKICRNFIFLHQTDLINQINLYHLLWNQL